MDNIKALPSIYGGIRFRSRLEARWAIFFDKLGVKWEYEPEGFDMDGVPYLPDFRLISTHKGLGGAYAEVKPAGGDYSKAKRLASMSKKDVIILEGQPAPTAILKSTGWCGSALISQSCGHTYLWWNLGEDPAVFEKEWRDLSPADFTRARHAAFEANNYRFDRRS